MSGLNFKEGGLPHELPVRISSYGLGIAGHVSEDGPIPTRPSTPFVLAPEANVS